LNQRCSSGCAVRAGLALVLSSSWLSSCGPPSVPATLAVQMALGGGTTATLRVEDAAGEDVAFDITVDGTVYRAAGEAPVRCLDGVADERPDDASAATSAETSAEGAAAGSVEGAAAGASGDGAGVGGAAGGLCPVLLTLDPGAYRFVLTLFAHDRCGVTARTASFSSGPGLVTVGRDGSNDIALLLDQTDFDDDGDGIVNALERAVCGRFDVADGALPPQACQRADDPCCSRDPSALQGQRSVFAGGAHRRADGVDVDVGPFSLDATEATWATFARCVAAGACLPGQPDHAVRQRLSAATSSPDVPVTGLLPAEAQQLCVWQGGRLPDDDEWDFAAAHRDGGARGRYPFDLPDGVTAIGCRETVDGIPAANHAARAQDCPDDPLPVGSYPSTFVTRGLGRALADLAGNVGEWTVRRGGPDPSVTQFPAGVIEVAVRGGAAGGIVELLENDFALRVRSTTPGLDERLQGLAVSTGVRCAHDVVDVVAAAAVVVEPACKEP
jgi:hypothetical protein